MRDTVVCALHDAQQYSTRSAEKRKSGVVTVETSQQTNEQHRYTDMIFILVKTASRLGPALIPTLPLI